MLVLAISVWPTVPWAGPRHTLQGAAISNPVGAFVRYDLRVAQRGGLSVSLFDSFLILSNEVGGQVSWSTEPAWFEAHLDAAVEPGFYRQLGPEGSSASPGEANLDRTFGVRGIVRAQVNINLKLSRIWLYSRTTGYVRFRHFVEDDSFARLRVQTELSFEQAVSVPVCVLRSCREVGVWVYPEYTVGVVAGAGLRPNRVSAGVVVERWPWRGFMWNLDGFYSFADRIDGPGFIVAFWQVW